MRILHTESSSGWGGQEIRILKEALGLQTRGHEFFFAIAKGGGLAAKAREKGFTVYEMTFRKPRALSVVLRLLRIIRKHKIDLIVTHSSTDSWLGGIAARLAGCKVVRMRHLSTAIMPGLNSFLLYKKLADFVVTTSTSTAVRIQEQAKISPSNCVCVPTGVEPHELICLPEEVKKFREKLGVLPSEYLVGTACFVRSWKGIGDLLKAASLLKQEKQIKWVIIGGGYVDKYRPLAEELGVEDQVIFTGHMEVPYPAISALDIFLLLSTAHEGISQASLQAAYLEKPLVTTSVGGLPEVCLEGVTGMIVPPFHPKKVAEAVMHLVERPNLCKEYGQNGKKLVEEKFTFASTLDRMEMIYASQV
jgi:glycosyltransferase involved in cell wall biosynthesis